MITRNEIVSEARRWIGTPYRHQGTVLGAGADCLGLIRGVWRNLIGEEPEAVPSYTPDWSEPSADEALYHAAARWLVPKPISSADPGDVLLFRMRNGSVAKHLGIAAFADGRPSFVHSYTDHGVVETSLSIPWARRIAARFDFPRGVK